MPSTASLIKVLTRDFPGFTFVAGESFQWASDTKTITYNPGGPAAQQHTLHELAHAVLQHQTYIRDIQLIDMEREAWAYADNTLSKQYGIPIHDEVKHAALDSYRDWMHARSTCPNCNATGIEVNRLLYQCPACLHEWRVNEARMCGLKRYTIKK